MRIVHVLAGSPHPNAANGVRRGVYALAAEQAKLGDDVAIVYFSDRDSGTAGCGVSQRRFPSPRIPFVLPSGFLAEITSCRPDVLHLHQPYSPSNARIAGWARRRSLPYVVTPHGALSPGELSQRGFLKHPYKRLFELPILNSAAFVQVLAPSERLEQYGVTAPLVQAPNGYNAAEIPDKLDSTRLEQAVPEVRGRRVYLFLGRLDPAQKGLDMLIQAAAQSGLRNSALVLIGPDWRGGRKRLERMARGASSNFPVRVLDSVYGQAKYELMAGADVFVHPSRWEGMPQAVLEAAALGLPTLLTPVADPWGRLAEQDAAWTVEANPGSIAKGLQRAGNAEDAQLREMGSRARQTVFKEFHWRRAAEALREGYLRYALGPENVAPELRPSNPQSE